MDILRFTEALMKGESIEEHEHQEYEPITGTNLNNSSDIRIDIETQNLFIQLSESSLIIERRLAIADGLAYVNADNVALTNNALMHLFSNIKLLASRENLIAMQSLELLLLILQKVSWFMPHDGGQEKNPSIFDKVDVRNMYVMLNSTRYPVVDNKLCFSKQQLSRVYGDAATFRSKFYRMDDLQSDRLKISVTGIQVKTQFNTNVPSGTEAFAVVICDKMISFQSDGNKMSVVY
uniref:Uncharacterized protein n=1 Tax=Octopus bimaculoides TaxID=37653 RepID=A0A0L8FW05_OCTBM